MSMAAVLLISYHGLGTELKAEKPFKRMHLFIFEPLKGRAVESMIDIHRDVSFKYRDNVSLFCSR